MRIALVLVLAATARCASPALACVSAGDCPGAQQCAQGVCVPLPLDAGSQGEGEGERELRIAPATAGILRGAEHRLRVRALEDEGALVGNGHILRLSPPALSGASP